MTNPPPPTPTALADAGTPPDPMRDVLSVPQVLMVKAASESGIRMEQYLARIILTLATRLASAKRERDALREEVREYELRENCRAKG